MKYFFKNRLYILSFLVFLTLIFLGKIVLIPKINEVKAAREELKKQKDYLIALNKKLEDLEKIDGKRLRTDFDMINLGLPSDKNVSLLFLTLEKLAYESSVSLSDINLTVGSISTSSAEKKTSGTEELGSIPFQISVVGELENLENFLVLLSTTLPVLGINSFSLGFNPEQKEVSLGLNLSFYYQPQPKTIGKISGPLMKISVQENNLLKQIESFKSYVAITMVETPSVTVGRENPFKRF